MTRNVASGLDIMTYRDISVSIPDIEKSPFGYAIAILIMIRRSKNDSCCRFVSGLSELYTGEMFLQICQ